MQLVLASTSPFRREILNKLHLDFQCESPSCDETPASNESADALVTRLAYEKALSCADDPSSERLIIGSDQVCVLNGQIVGKPHTKSVAIEQLNQASGKVVTFYTGLCVLNSKTKEFETIVEPFKVHFRTLSSSQINRYLDMEQPYQCAGSFKSEGLGIALFERLEGDDPNALIGLPLIRLIKLLERFGIQVI